MNHFSQTGTHRHHIHREPSAPTNIIVPQHTPNHIHVSHSGSASDEPSQVKAYAAELTAQINHSRKIIREDPDYSLRRTHLQLLKERLSTVHQLIGKYRYLRVSTESLMKVEEEIFKAERELITQFSVKPELNTGLMISRIRELKSQRKYDDAEKLLLHCIALSETSAESMGSSPWYYEQITEIYRHRKEYAKEVAVLDRYLRKAKAPGTKRGHLYEQLKEARRLVENFGAKGV